jgi:tetratricopeptide (TPR) repeat protein
VERTKATSASSATFDLLAFRRDKLSELRCIRGGKAYDDGRPNDAFEPINSAIRLDPNYHQAFRMRGMAYAAIGNNEAAIRDYSEAIRIKPDFAQAYKNRAAVYQLIGNFQSTEEDFDQALRIDSEFALAYIDRGAYFFNDRKHFGRAIADFQRALKIDPTLEVARNNLKIVYASKEADDAALSRWTQAIEQNADDVVALTQRGRIYFIRNDYGDAMGDFNRAIKLSPETTDAREMRAAILSAVGRLDECIAEYAELCRLKPDAINAQFNTGVVYERLGRPDDAIKCFRRVLELQPGAQDAINSLARLQMQRGN